MTDDTPSQRGNPSTEPLAAILAAAADDHRPRRLRRWLAVALAVIIVAAIGWAMFGERRGGVSYVSAKATEGSLTVTVTATGSVQPTGEVDVSSELSGRIKAVNVDYNSPVKVGDILAELVTDNLDSTVASARAKLAAAKANVAKAHATIASTKNTLDSKTVLVTRNVSSPQDLIDAKANYDAAVAGEQAANAETAAAEADLSLAETNLSKAVIRSPIDGIVLTRSVDPGATVAASLSAPTLFVIAGDLRQMELQVDVDEADVGKTRIGQAARFTVDAYPEQSFPAQIKDIRFVSETTNNVVTYKALLTVDNSALLLRPGMTATAEIVVEEVKNATLIPNASLRYAPPATGQPPLAFGFFRAPRLGAITEAEPTGRGRRVYVMRDGAAVPLSIEIGASDGINTVVTSGDVKPGDDLVIDTASR